MNNTLDREAIFLTGSKGRFFVINTKTGGQLKPGDEVLSHRGEPGTLLSVTRGPEYNGTAKVLVRFEDGWQQEYYSTVFDLLALPIIETERQYRLDIYDRNTMVRKFHLVQIAGIEADRTVTAYELDDDGVLTGRLTRFSWDNVYIAETLS